MDKIGYSSTPRVLITLCRGIIAVRYFSWLSSSDKDAALDPVGISAQREDEGRELFVCDNLNPTFRDLYGINVPDTASYEQKKAATLRATGWEFEEEFRWLTVDQNGDVVPGTDTDETITRWLNCKVDDIDELCSWCTKNVPDEYYPGRIIYNALTPDERLTLGLVWADLGGPASTVPCVKVTASIEELNSVLAAKGLPFVVLDDEEPEEI
jgi:hypothetical protein